jgi:hypothetical protein
MIVGDDGALQLLMKRSPPIAQGGGLFCGFVISLAAPRAALAARDR